VVGLRVVRNNVIHAAGLHLIFERVQVQLAELLMAGVEDGGLGRAFDDEAVVGRAVLEAKLTGRAKGG
jgi:hypothetical protein